MKLTEARRKFELGRSTTMVVVTDHGATTPSADLPSRRLLVSFATLAVFFTTIALLLQSQGPFFFAVKIALNARAN